MDKRELLLASSFSSLSSGMQSTLPPWCGSRQQHLQITADNLMGSQQGVSWAESAQMDEPCRGW